MVIMMIGMVMIMIFDDGHDDCDDNHAGVSMLYLTHNNVKIIE